MDITQRVFGCTSLGGIGEAKGRRVVEGAIDVFSGVGMLEGTANGDWELESTEHELSAFEILLDSVSLY